MRWGSQRPKQNMWTCGARARHSTGGVRRDLWADNTQCVRAYTHAREHLSGWTCSDAQTDDAEMGQDDQKQPVCRAMETERRASLGTQCL